MIVTVTTDDLDETLRNEGSVVRVTGTSEDGERITFAGDHRPMADFVGAVMDDGEARCEVEDWQILGRSTS